MKYTRASRIHAPASKVFSFHEAPGALKALTPPWQKAEIVKPPASLAVGTEVILRVRIGPFWQTIVAHHIEYEAGHLFADEMVKGPFAKWVHRHIVEPASESESTLIDEVTYELPLGAVGAFFGGAFARHELERMFAYRHAVTKAACEA